ncbi:hypothetical protein F5Y17DRAFT_49569 [Xylariaceae sp. FL0594]|nr:hypothetical protein F5Y17DRAFT_49569 [Xylariaceae sp. FL0594]
MSAPSPEQIAFMAAHSSDDLRPNIIACVSASAALAALIVGGRLFSRLVQGGYLLGADYLILFALIIFIPYCVALALATDFGLGKHVIFVNNARLLQIYFITSEVIYSVTIVCVKLSILAFYWRIFPQKWFRRALVVVAAFMGGWMFATVFSIVFQCWPVEYNWDKSIPGGHCIDAGMFGLATSILNVVTDVTILALPLPMIWSLHLPARRRWSLSCLFALGGGACIVGITRAGWIGKLNRTADPTWDNVPAVYLSTIELLAGFLVACIPSYAVLFKRLAGGSKAAKSMTKQSNLSGGGVGGVPGGGRPGRRPPHQSWNRIEDVDEVELVSRDREP